jgi:hypothetical protein
MEIRASSGWTVRTCFSKSAGCVRYDSVMADSDSGPAAGLHNIERALRLLTALREDTGGESDWLKQEMKALRTSDDPIEYVATLGSMMAALTQVANYLLIGWAGSTGQSPEDLVAIVRHIVETEIGTADE